MFCTVLQGNDVQCLQTFGFETSTPYTNQNIDEENSQIENEKLAKLRL